MVRILKCFASLLLLALFTIPSLQARPTQSNIVKVTRVVAGDTIRVLYQGKDEPVRLIGIDIIRKQENRFAHGQRFTMTWR